jgi:hypothetical protein
MSSVGYGVVFSEDFNVILPRVLGSNTSGSTQLTSTFPTSSTGTSLGHYHYTEATTNSLKFLNASGTGQGGHQFWHSSSTQAPIKVLETNRIETLINTQLNVDKSTQGTPILIDLPDITISTDVVVVFASPINQPPWNIVGLGNPIQVTQNTANMVTGTTYYLSAFSTQLGQVTTNPDGTGIIDCTDLVNLPQPILTWESGQFNPSTIQTAILSDTLEITTDTDVSVLSATDLTFNGTSILSTPSTFSFTINTLPFSFPFVSTGLLTPQSSFSITATASSLTLITPTISTSSIISATLYRDNVFSPLSVSLTTNSIILTGDFSGTQTIYFSGFIFLQ